MDKEENKDEMNKAVIDQMSDDDPDRNADDHGKIQGGNKRKGIDNFDDPPQPKRVRNHPVQKIENADQERSGNIDDQKDNNLQKSYRGVTKTPAGKFRARIWDSAEKKKRNLGTFAIEENAAKAYRTAKERKKGEKMGNVSSSRGSAGEAGTIVGFGFGSASEALPSPLSVLQDSTSASINAGGAPGAGREANTMEMLGVEPSGFISELIKKLKSELMKFNPEISEGALLYNCNMQERPLAGLIVVEDMPRDQRMAMPGSGSGIGSGPSNQVMINAAMKAMEEDQRQPFLTSKSSSSVGKESSSILRITEKLQAIDVSDHHASEKLELSTSTLSLADPAINSILNSPENSQYGNDLEQLGLGDNLPLCNEADNEHDQHLDHPVNEDSTDHLNENALNEQENP